MAEVSYRIVLKDETGYHFPEVLYTYEDESVPMIDIYNTYSKAFPDKIVEIEKGFAGPAS